MTRLYLPPTVERPTEPNQAGGCYLQLIPASQIASMPDEVRGTVPSDITLVEGATWITIQPTLWTQEFSDQWVRVEGAQHSRAELELVVPKDREELLYGLWQLHGGRFVAIHYDRNKTAKLIGTKDEPAMVRMVRLEHGSRPGAGRNQYLLQVTVSRRTPCPFYLGTPPEIFSLECPNLTAMLSSNSAATIATALEAAGVLAAVQAIICETCPTLCQMLDDAIVLGGGSEFTGVDVVLNLQSGSIPATGTTNGKPSGSTTDFPSGFAEFLWNGSAWMVSDGFSTWTSTEDVDTPGEVTTWSGSDPLPTVDDVFSGGSDASAVVDCLNSEQRAALAAALGALGPTLCDQIAAAMPGDYSDCIISSGHLEGILPLLLPSVDPVNVEEWVLAHMAPEQQEALEGIVRTTDASTDVLTVPAAGSANLPQSVIKYRNLSNVLTETAPSNTEFGGGVLKPATEIPRRALRNSAGTGFNFVHVGQLVDDTVPTMPDSTITRPDGTTFNNPAGVAVDMRTYRSGIVYNFGYILHSGQQTVYQAGDEGTMFANGFFNYVRPVYPTHYAELGADWYTLANNNIFGNTLRFTNRSGGAAASSGNRFIIDHLTEIEYYVLGTFLTAANWQAAVTAGININATLGETGWYLPPERIMDSITNDNSAAFFSAAPFSVPGTQPIWTSSTAPGNTTQAKAISLVSGAAINAPKTTNTYIHGIYCRRFI